jgi:hypothetical protein
MKEKAETTVRRRKLPAKRGALGFFFTIEDIANNPCPP